MHIPVYQTLAPTDFIRAGSEILPYPFNAPNACYAFMARNLIFHLFCKLSLRPDEFVLMPDYNSGVEVWAVRAAGAQIRYYPIKRNLEPDIERLSQLCKLPGVRVLYVIHYFGWPQPMAILKSLCRQRNILVIEDCALALLSEVNGQPLGVQADYSLFCLYKSLPVPHGGMLVRNGNKHLEMPATDMHECSTISLLGRTLDLLLDRVRLRSSALGDALVSSKRGIGKVLDFFDVERLSAGDISPDYNSPGFSRENMNVGCSRLCRRLLHAFDYDAIKRRRRANYLLLQELLADCVQPIRTDLSPGVCPLFFPLLVANKHDTALRLRARHIGAMEVWNYGLPDMKHLSSRDADYLRAHVLELPIHQDLSEEHIEYVAHHVQTLYLRGRNKGLRQSHYVCHRNRNANCAVRIP